MFTILNRKSNYETVTKEAVWVHVQCKSWLVHRGYTGLTVWVHCTEFSAWKGRHLNWALSAYIYIYIILKLLWTQGPTIGNFLSILCGWKCNAWQLQMVGQGELSIISNIFGKHFYFPSNMEIMLNSPGPLLAIV